MVPTPGHQHCHHQHEGSCNCCHTPSTAPPHELLLVFPPRHCQVLSKPNPTWVSVTVSLTSHLANPQQKKLKYNHAIGHKADASNVATRMLCGSSTCLFLLPTTMLPEISLKMGEPSYVHQLLQPLPLLKVPPTPQPPN
jgi:hypothetical protein